jgi:HprK-related kinase B
VANEQGQGIVFSCESGRGKSTMAVTLLEHGFKFMSNDRVLTKVKGDTVELVGLPKKPRVNPGTIMAIPSLRHLLSSHEYEFYSSLDIDKLWKMEHKFDVEVNDLFGPGAFKLQGKLKSVYLLDWHRNNSDGMQVQPVMPAMRASLLHPNVLNLDPRRKQTRNVEEIEAELAALSGAVDFFSAQGAVDMAKLAQIVKTSLP